MTPTLRDVLLMTGLPVIGSLSLMAIDPSDPALPRVSISSQEFTSYASVAKKDYNLVSVPTVTEHIQFLWVLVCKFIICPAGGKPTMEYLPLARSLAIGPSFALGTLLLGSTYHALRKCVTDDPVSKMDGSLWFVQLWLLANFPELRHPDCNFPNGFVGSSLMQWTLDVQDPFATILLLGRERDSSLLFILTHNHHLPSWIHCQTAPLTLVRDYLFCHFVTHREIIVCGTQQALCPSSTPPFLEVYCPQMGSRQLGLESCVPRFEFARNPPDPLPQEQLQSYGRDESVSCPVQPLSFSERDMFKNWWPIPFSNIIQRSIGLSMISIFLRLESTYFLTFTS